MKTLIITFLAATFLTGCDYNLNLGEDGNGNVVTEDRTVTADFDKLEGNSGLDVILTQGPENKVTVEADENLLDLIETNIQNGKLTITTSKNIGDAEATKIYVTFKNLSAIEASSGAEITGNSVVKSENLNLETSSGASLELEIFSKEVVAQSSSGSDLTLSGKSSTLKASASSGSELDAKDLMVIHCVADAASGASILVQVKTDLEAQVSSGGDIKYYGNPTDVSQNDTYSGSVQKM